jgi:hypothetical protein
VSETQDAVLKQYSHTGTTKTLTFTRKRTTGDASDLDLAEVGFFVFRYSALQYERF